MAPNDQRIEIVRMRQRGKTIMEIARELHLDKSNVHRILKRFNELGTYEDRERSGRPRSARTAPIIRRIKEKIRRKPKRSKRQMARVEGISEGSVRNIVRQDLKNYSYKLQEAQHLDENKKKIRKEKCQTLIRRFQRGSHKSFVFSDEKLFVVEEKFNKQNVRIIAKDIGEASAESLIRNRSWSGREAEVREALVKKLKSLFARQMNGIQENIALRPTTTWEQDLDFELIFYNAEKPIPLHSDPLLYWQKNASYEVYVSPQVKSAGPNERRATHFFESCFA